MTSEFDPVPARMPQPPKKPLPAGACDTHTHVFGPFDPYPVPTPSSYAPPIAPPSVHDEMLRTAGFDRAILVQPAPYGTDNSALIEALKGRPGKLRGIGVLSSAADDAAFDALAEAGARGLRFNEMKDPRSGGRYKGSIGIDEYPDLFGRMKEYGLLPHVWAKVADLANFLPGVVNLGMPWVIDHMAAINVEAGVGDPAFQALLRHLRNGDIWVKLSLCRNSPADYADQRPFHEALINANPTRLLWGSDWPFVRMYERSPDVGELLDIFSDWTGDETLRRAILVDNPAELYGFGNATPAASSQARRKETLS